MAENELVLHLGVEGGGAHIYRTSLASGGWLFHVEGSSMDFDENDDEVWPSWTGDPVQTIEEALRSIAGDGIWVCFHPVSVHSKYRTLVWELVQETAGKLPEKFSSTWERRSHDWQHLCLETS